MRLFISNPSNEKLDEFIYEYVIPEIQITFGLKLNSIHCQRWTKYFRSRDLGWRKYKNNKNVIPTAEEILISGVKNLRVLNCNNTYIVEINPNEIAPKTNAKLIDICSLINYGNLDQNPYPIFEEAFADVASRLTDLYQEYLKD